MYNVVLDCNKNYFSEDGILDHIETTVKRTLFHSYPDSGFVGQIEYGYPEDGEEKYYKVWLNMDKLVQFW